MVGHRSRRRNAGPGERAAFAALAVTSILTIVKVTVWAVTDSLAVLSQAVDSALDLVALGMVYVAVRVAGKPADEQHHYGHAKAENLVAFTQTLLLGAVVVAVAFQAVGRLAGDSVGVDAPIYAIALFGISAAIDVVRVRWLAAAARAERSEALRAGALNLSFDIGTALVTLASLLLVNAGVERADAIGALIVGTAVGIAAWRLGKRSVDVLMDRVPDVAVASIEAAASDAPGVAETRRIRVRGSGKQLFADVTVAAGRTASLERAHDIAENVEREIARVAPGADVVVHVEPSSETTDLLERVQAAAGRQEGVTEVHNVLLQAFERDGERKLHVTLHAKVAPSTPLEEAHDMSDRIERAVKEELGAEVRVDTHIEPLQPTSVGADVTALRRDVVDAVRRLALQEEEVVDCHEVLVADVGGELSVVAHVRGRGTLPLTRIHEASERIESRLHATHPEVGPVLIHFEPA